MTSWSFDILRQSGWDLWAWVCLVAAAVLLVQAGVVLRRPGLRPVVLGLCFAGMLGTVIVLSLPFIRSAYTGLAWTFLLLCILSATFYSNLLPQLGRRRTGLLLGLRVAALALLVPMLFEPVVRYVSRPRPEKPLIFLIDASGSMSVPDVQNGPTRLQSVWQTLRPQLPRLQDHFVPRFYAFSAAVQPLASPNDLATTRPDGQATDLVAAVGKGLEAATHDGAMLVLISDGIDNTSPGIVEAVRSSARPVHTITVGSDQAEPATMMNVAVDALAAPDDFTVGSESTIRATIKSSALSDRLVDVKLSQVDPDGRLTGEPVFRRLVLQPVTSGQTVELPFKPTKVGVQRLAVWIDPIAGERSTIDNRQELQGLALDPRIRVLYVEGRARPEYRELARALGRDTNIEVATLLRIQQDRFAASGTVDGEPLRQLPQTLEQWRKFDVVLLGDLDASFLSPAQQGAIEQLVADGKGLLMIGGQNSFGPGGYAGTPIEKALPVMAGTIDSPQETTQFVPKLVNGDHPAMEGLADWLGTLSQAPAKELPPLRGNVVVPGAKTGAEVLLVHHDRLGPDGQPQVVLAVHRYGKGRSAAFTADTTYLWYLPLRGMGQDSPYNRFWGQLVRWLANQDVRNRQRGAGLEALIGKSVYQLGETVRVRAMVRDEKGDATRYAQMSVSVRSTSRPEAKQQPLAPSEARTGMYDVELSSLDQGEWTAELVATKDGKELGRQTLRFTVIPPADEMLRLAANPTLMAEIAQQTRGFSYPLAQLPTLIDELIRTDPAPQAVQRSIPLHNTVRTLLALAGRAPDWPRRYDLPVQAVLVVGLLVSEWMLRRKWQLP